MSTFEREVSFIKVEESLGLILGFAIVCEENGEPYFDVQGDHIPPDAMLKASADFMEHSQLGGIMHRRDEDGEPVPGGKVVFAWPMTAEIAASLDMTTKRTGLLVGIKPSEPEDLEKARRGEFRGFSIGGGRIKDEDVNDE
jgi:hypothetical protein